ncbi:hypothetical protein TWF281_011381 [Arthrobotrys megalospora]
MSDTRLSGEEFLREEEHRLLRELEETKPAERVRKLKTGLERAKAAWKIEELNHERERVKATWRIKVLERELEDAEAKGRVGVLEPQIGESDNRDIFLPYPNTQRGESPTPDHVHNLVIIDNYTFAPVESVGDLEAHQTNCSEASQREAIQSEARDIRNAERPARMPGEGSEEAHRSPTTSPAPSSPGAGLGNMPNFDHGVQASARLDCSSSQISTSASGPLISQNVVGQASGTLEGILPDSVLKVEYYQELDRPANAAEIEFFGMGLEELYEIVGSLEATSEEADAGHIELISRVYHLIFSRTNAISDIEKAIDRAEESVKLRATRINSPDYATCLRNLTTMLMGKYERTLSLDDLSRAIFRAEEMITIASPSHPDWKQRILGLFGMKSKKALRTGSLEEVEELMFMLENTPAVVARHTNLDIQRYMEKFEQTGDPDDLRLAIDATPHNHPGRVKLLLRLLRFFLYRFTSSEDFDALQMAIKTGEEALAATPRGHPDRHISLHLLAECLQSRSRHTGNSDDLQIANRMVEEALAALPHDSPDRAMLLDSMSEFHPFKGGQVNLDDKYEATMALYRDLEAKESRRPLGNANRNLDMATTKSLLPDQGVIYVATALKSAMPVLKRYLQTGNLDDLETMIKTCEEVLLKISQLQRQHLVETMRDVTLFFLANCLERRFDSTGTPSDFKRAIDCLVEITELTRLPAAVRIGAARDALTRLVRRSMWAEASRVAEVAVNLLPSTGLRQLNQRDQQRLLREYPGLAGLATSVTLDAGKDAYHAVRLLELGRGVIAGLRFGTRSDLTELRDQQPEMAAKFERLRDILDPPNSTMPGSVMIDTAATILQKTTKVHDAGIEFEKTINEIRLLPNFRNFLLPPQADEMMAAASQGPVVLINVSRRCDALIVEETSIRSIRLPDLHESQVEKYAKLLRSIRSSHALPSDATSKLSGMLEWLWDVAVSPILDELGFRETPVNGDWPRIWWIPTGQLSFLPLHAAGYHSPPFTKTTLDRVVSSYSPSIKALLYARQNSQKNTDLASGEALFVSMDTTPGYPDLRFAREEVNMLEKILPGHFLKRKLERPSKRELLDQLKSCKIFHFAGHGESDPLDPSKSSLLVSDWKDNPLTVESLIGLDLRLQSPVLAYLSACSTSESDAEELLDEGIHLAAACQLAGFQHVVGSIWEVSDRYSVEAATEIYGTIGNAGTIDGKAISLGVHRATRLLRDITSKGDREQPREPVTSNVIAGDGEMGNSRSLIPLGSEKKDQGGGSNPLIWAPYIHVGP